MNYSFNLVEQKVRETEFFLKKMIEEESEWFEFSCYLTAFLSVSRSITFALQQYKKIEGFERWYEAKQEILSIDPIAKYFLEIRNKNIHTGMLPIAGAQYFDGKVEYRFDNDNLKLQDIVSSCRIQFIKLLEIVYDCYVVLSAEIDPQQYYTKEHFATMELDIDNAECMIWGWVMSSYIEEGMDEDDRWHELRSRVGECEINHLFKGYLNKVTPQPIIPDRIADFDFSDEDRGWDYIPSGFETIEEYRNYSIA